MCPHSRSGRLQSACRRSWMGSGSNSVSTPRALHPRKPCLTAMTGFTDWLPEHFQPCWCRSACGCPPLRADLPDAAQLKPLARRSLGQKNPAGSHVPARHQRRQQALERTAGNSPDVSGSRWCQRPRDCRGRSAAHRMSEATRANAFLLANLRGDVVDDVVRMTRVAAHAARYMIESERTPCSPGNIVIGARAVATDANRPDQHVRSVIERQPAAEHIHTADAMPHHRVIRLAEACRGSVIGDARVDGVAVL